MINQLQQVQITKRMDVSDGVFLVAEATTAGATMSRHFESGTWVEWDVEANTGTIHWAPGAGG